MKSEILISTMDDKFLNRKYNISFNHLIINQLLSKENSNFILNNLYSFKEKGLSKSRNRAIECTKADIVLISDDDLFYVPEIEKILVEAHNKYKEVDIITFQIETPEGKPYKQYKEKPFWHNYKSLIGVSSVEISFKTNSIKNNNLKFDEKFGLGSTFPTGEEVIFLTDALKKGLKILYLPIPIVIHPPVSSGGDYKNLKLIEAKGSVFYRIFGNLSYFLLLYFSIRKYKYSNFGFFKFYFTLLRGVKKFKTICRNSTC